MNDENVRYVNVRGMDHVNNSSAIILRGLNSTGKRSPSRWVQSDYLTTHSFQKVTTGMES